jgi:dihydrofolate reductase
MEIGAAVRGNRRYVIKDALPYGGQIKVPQFVVTHKPRDQPTIGGLTFTFTESLENAIILAKAAAGERSITLLGSSTNQRALNAGLVDEILTHLAPVLIGEGIRLFDNLNGGISNWVGTRWDPEKRREESLRYQSGKLFEMGPVANDLDTVNEMHIRGRIEWDEESEGELPRIATGRRVYSWLELSKELMTYEGFDISITIL